MIATTLLGIAALATLARFLLIRDRRIARQEYAPYFAWCYRSRA